MLLMAPLSSVSSVPHKAVEPLIVFLLDNHIQQIKPLFCARATRAELVSVSVCLTFRAKRSRWDVTDAGDMYGSWTQLADCGFLAIMPCDWPNYHCPYPPPFPCRHLCSLLCLNPLLQHFSPSPLSPLSPSLLFCMFSKIGDQWELRHPRVKRCFALTLSLLQPNPK